MMQQIANHTVDHDSMMILRRTHDTVRYIRWVWNKDHAEPIDAEELRLFLCDEHYGDLTDEQKSVARRCRDEMRDVYAEMCLRLLQSGIMLEHGMVPDSSTYRSVFCSEGGDTPWMLDRAGCPKIRPICRRRKKSRRKDRGRKRPCPSHKCPQCGHFQGFMTGDRGTLLSGVCTLWNAPSSSFLSVCKGFYRRHTGPKPYFYPDFEPIVRSKLAEKFSSYFRKSVVVVCVTKRKRIQRK